MPKHGKKYLEAAKLIDKTKLYPILEAAELLKKVSYGKFDASVETCFRLNVDPRHGTGKSQKVLVITQGPKEQEAKDAGADIVGGKEILEQIKGGWFDFDVIVATPDMMGELGKLGKLLGPKGLMPNPKTGTVTMDLKKAVDEIKKGKVTYRTDKQGNINCAIGKVSFSAQQLAENAVELLNTIQKLKPQALKGTYVRSIFMSATMSPGICIDTKAISATAE